MNIRIIRFLILVLLGSCGGGDTPAGPPSRFLFAYAVNGGDADVPTGGIYSFGVYPGGVLSIVSGSPTPTGQALQNTPIAITRDSKALYSGNDSLELLAFQINADGSLTAAPVPFYKSFSVGGLAIHPTADFLYVSCFPGLAVFAIDSATDALTLTSTVDLGTAVTDSAATTPNGEFLYQSSVTNDNAPPQLQIAGFSTNTATGALSPIPGITSTFESDSANTTVIDPSGKFLYVGYQFSVGGLGYYGGVAAYSIDAASGELTDVPGSPFSVDGAPNSAAIDASGKFLIVSIGLLPGVASPSPNCLAVFSIESGTGTLTPVPGSPFGPFDTCEGVAADPSGEYVYVGSVSTVSVLSIDQATGELAPISQATLPGAMGVSFIALTR
jgi:6-phosphogluconolactonase (cycloisomerase 2 family)